jgi:hypothetical protein
MRHSPGGPSAETLKQLHQARRGEHDEAFRPGQTFECDSGTAPHRAATAIGADQIATAVLGHGARRTAHLHADGIRALRQVDNFVIEQYFHVRKPLQSVEDQLYGFELLALHDERMPRVMLENNVIELRDGLLLGRSQNWKVGATKPTRAMSSSSPSSLNRSSVAGCVVAARGSACGSRLLSNRRTPMPRRPSS